MDSILCNHYEIVYGSLTVPVLAVFDLVICILIITDYETDVRGRIFTFIVIDMFGVV